MSTTDKTAVDKPEEDATVAHFKDADGNDTWTAVGSPAHQEHLDEQEAETNASTTDAVPASTPSSLAKGKPAGEKNLS